ncbi:MAG: tyrosine--tRNA ligase [Halobacteriales archaeon]|nr:tyrosine--tRNA ligase [Halobacteriales archaeon]
MDARLAAIVDAAAEVVGQPELEALVQSAEEGKRPKAYVGFEPSGTAHIGWMVCTDMVRRLTAAGFDTTILLADWHAQINDKLGGDLAAIQACGRYMMEAFEALGVPKSSVRYVWANDLAADPGYWATVVRVLKNTTLARMRRAMTIMGRAEDEGDGDMSKFLYPAMQVADIFFMEIDVAYGGLDQRHAHMLARDVSRHLGRKPPVAIHTPLVPSLKGPGRMDPGEAQGAAVPKGMGPKGAAAMLANQQFVALLQAELAKGVPEAEAMVEAQHRFASQQMIEGKMSKSDPDSGIFIHDAPEDVKRKLKAAHCPAKEVDGNPVLDLLRLVVWPRLADLHRDGPPRFEIHRPEKFGGNKLYLGYEALLAEDRSGALHPLDLKMGVADALNVLLEPVRRHFQRHPETLAFVQGLKRTR